MIILLFKMVAYENVFLQEQFTGQATEKPLPEFSSDLHLYLEYNQCAGTINLNNLSLF